ncbi:MAG TPA: DUF1699 family protein [Methanothrix sp.]|jgi:hypothetical protein|nr:DUF1699 family protein [Methanothrix sp.]OPX80666.1 MAG: hypothetical protein A4E50_01474 [Methanosaeta sp. PtaB.Bin087]OPY56927.1 MAG: hypothetical protein A4E51_00251 [Methanosaeta sp. PtaU1.Bin055]HNR58809.1 DUF1699 family protein [Methanothrix sp.]HOI68489.1 DUF1699 family protein [Methanothrix sp.]
MIKIRIVSSKDDINDLTRSDHTVHLAYRATSTDMFRLLQYSPRLRAVQVPPSYYRNMPNTARAFLETQGVEIIEGDVWGHRKDIDEYFVVDDEMIGRITDLQSGGLKVEEISSRICWESKLSPAMVNYIIKQRT